MTFIMEFYRKHPVSFAAWRAARVLFFAVTVAAVVSLGGVIFFELLSFFPTWLVGVFSAVISLLFAGLGFFAGRR